jgi:glyoxylase-like metal-dependent hydrolase (beta-lactamase superfamily II)
MQTATPTAAADIRIHTYASPGAGSVNTHWVESASGVVVIDAQRLVSQAGIVLNEIAKTGKPVEALILTHAHPDHIGGAKAFTDAFPHAAVIASQPVIDTMRSDEGGLLALARYWLAEDFAPVEPTRALADGETLSLAGLSFATRQMGPGESSSVNVLFLAKAGALFAADVVFHAMTPYLAERRTGQWLRQLERLQETFPSAAVIYPGHGAPSDARALIAHTRDYLSRVRELVAARRAREPELTPEVRAALVSEIERLYPDYLPVAAIPDVVGLNVEGVWAEFAGQDSHPAGGAPSGHTPQKQ